MRSGANFLYPRKVYFFWTVKLAIKSVKQKLQSIFLDAFHKYSKSFF